MKKKTFVKYCSLIFTIVLVFTFIACESNPNDQNENSSTDENAPTERQIWLPYAMLDHSENCIRRYYYDEYGNEIKTTKEDLNGNLQGTWLYEYDDNQNLIKRSVDTGDGTPFIQLI
ncbi:MAG: hypothetical protein IJW92_06405 [Clostridia bacterium]|nr:hypothetical protein [Clostridia bacterium]